MIGKSLSHYRIESELGHGGMGVVYLAKDTKLDRILAIKFRDSDFTSGELAEERFIREAKPFSQIKTSSR